MSERMHPEQPEWSEFGIPPEGYREEQAMEEPRQEQQGHIFELSENGREWGLLHPRSCTPNLLDCPVHYAVMRDKELMTVEPGRYALTLDDDGLTARLIEE